MAPRILITGISGYIGGQVLDDVASKHSDYQIRGLVRNVEQQNIIAAKYPSAQTVIGDLDSKEVLIKEAAQADVILQLANADHNPSILSLIQNIPKTGTFIQLSGAASIFASENGIGQLTPKVWNDISDIHEITTFDHSHLHAVTDQLVISEGKKYGIKTAIVAPPNVYGTGTGPVKTTSMMLPWLVDAVKKRGRGFTISEGKHVISMVHIRDLSAAILLLVEQALEGSGKADWGEKGWYYVESGSCVFADLVEGVVKEMWKMGLVRSDGVDVIGVEEARSLHPWAELLWGMNMRVSGERIRGLGWRPKEVDIFDSISESLSSGKRKQRGGGGLD